MMKTNKILLSLIGLIIGLTLTNCEDITSENNTTTASFNTYDELVQGRLPSIYASLRSDHLYKNKGILHTWADAGIDTHSGTLFPAFFNPFFAYTYTPSDGFIGETWSEFYTALKQINTFLGQIKTFEASTTQEERDPVIAEARFLRAMLYFDMVKIWGHIPLIINEDITLGVVREDADLPNSTPEEIYIQVIKDLKFVIENGNPRSGASPDIVSKEAAQALLGKVYLQMTTSKEYGGIEGGIDENGNPVTVNQRFEMAENELSQVISSGVFSLEQNYSDIFSIENNTEVIFSVGYDGPNNSTGGDFGDIFGFGNTKDGGWYGAYRINVDFAFEYLRADRVIDPNETGGTISGANLLPETNEAILASGISNFTTAARLLNPHNFVADVRFEHNVGRFNQELFAKMARGEETSTASDVYTASAQIWGAWSPYKYHKPIPNPNDANDGSIDYPFLRYADVLLMEAEALNALGRTEEARDYVNMVISRSLKDKVLKSIPQYEDPNVTTDPIVYVSPTEAQDGTPQSTLNNAINNNSVEITEGDYLLESGLSQDEMLDKIVLERAKELCYEGKRKDDLIRTGKLDEAIDKLHLNSVNRGVANQENVKNAFNLSKHTHWPIPQEEIQLNPNLKQNCEYGTGTAGCF